MNDWTIAAIAVSLFLAIWYGAGHIYNRQRGQRLMRWVHGGLDALGEEWQAGWIGSPASGARINVRRGHHPFRRLELTLLLENREIPFLWLLDRLRGRRDRIIMRATLRSPRHGEVMAFSNGPSDLGSEAWTWEESSADLRVASRGRQGQRMAESLMPWFTRYGSHIHRFHWRKQDPHINLQLSIGGLLETKADRVFADLTNALRST